MVQMLVETKVNLDYIEKESIGTVFQAASLRVDRDSTGILIYLLKTAKIRVQDSSEVWGSNLSTACLTANIDIIKMLLDCGTRLGVADEYGQRPIHFALYRTLELVKFLRSRGAELFVEDSMQRNALHFAIVSGRLDLVSYILAERKDLCNKEDCDGWTPLFWVLRECRLWDTQTSERKAIVAELQAHGARTFVRSSDRWWTPYGVARLYDLHPEIVELVTPSKSWIDESKDSRFWSILVHKFEPASRSVRGFCRACLMALVGKFYVCQSCPQCVLCFKCGYSMRELHPHHSFSCKYDDDEDNPDEDYPDGGYMDYILQDISYSDSDAGYDVDDQNDECEFEDAEDNDENIKGDN
ncbi:ankyrin repeat-containing domain protein [Aspergillus parasiticus]|uniref:Ankyrin repeat-containing domain protein n=1 Tax=Aspergillus parasiticus TaxID=5067 RepID=A0A5N6DLA6_ASPPA|nr:ankyrin repeat-containing domain protein [Aspergillus parasiticus]